LLVKHTDPIKRNETEVHHTDFDGVLNKHFVRNTSNHVSSLKCNEVMRRLLNKRGVCWSRLNVRFTKSLQT